MFTYFKYTIMYIYTILYGVLLVSRCLGVGAAISWNWTSTPYRLVFIALLCNVILLISFLLIML